MFLVGVGVCLCPSVIRDGPQVKDPSSSPLLHFYLCEFGPGAERDTKLEGIWGGGGVGG